MVKRDSSIWQWTGKRFRYVGGSELGGRRHTVYVSPRMVVKFEMDRAGMARLAVGQALKDATHSVVVHQAMPYAVQISPHGDTLEYVSSWQAVDTFAVIAGLRRAACKLLNTSGHAAAVEWVSPRGYGHGYGVLARTLAHLTGASPAGLEQAPHKTARKAFNSQAHPRGPAGRFAPAAQPSAATLRRRAHRAAQIRESGR